MRTMMHRLGMAMVTAHAKSNPAAVIGEDVVRAAIHELREPTPAMIAAAGPLWSLAAWQLAVDAIIAEDEARS